MVDFSIKYNFRFHAGGKTPTPTSAPDLLMSIKRFLRSSLVRSSWFYCIRLSANNLQNSKPSSLREEKSPLKFMYFCVLFMKITFKD